MAKWPDRGATRFFLQAEKIAAKVKGLAVVVVEDDIFSGGSVIKALEELRKQGVVIKKLIAGIQIGDPQKLIEMGIVVDPVVR